MGLFNANQAFSSKKQKSMPISPCPDSVKKALNVYRAFENGTFQIEPKGKNALYDRCYIFEDINYINKNEGEQRNFLESLMLWLNAMDADFKITLVNEYQDMDEFLAAFREERNKESYPQIAEGIRQWQEGRIEETNPNVTTLRYLTITARADSEASARIYLNAVEVILEQFFGMWGSRIAKLDAEKRMRLLQSIVMPGKSEEQEYIEPYRKGKSKRDWKNDILPRSIEQHKNFMIMGDTYVTVLFGHKYKKTVDSDTFIRNLSNVSYPSFLTLDFASVDADVIEDKLTNAQMNNDRAITEEMEQRRRQGILAVEPSYKRRKKKEDIEGDAERLESNDEKGFFMNLLVVITAEEEDTLADRVREMQAIGKKEKVILETCDFTQLKAWNTALPVGGRQVDYMRFFLTSSLVAFQPYHAQDVIELGGQMMGMNMTTKHFIFGNRKLLPNPHGIIIGFSGSGKSMFIKLTVLAHTLLSTLDDIVIIDPQNEFVKNCEEFQGSYFDLTPRSGIHLNGFEVSEEVFRSPKEVRDEFIASQTEYAKTLCAAAMHNITVTQEHDSIISRCTERMMDKVFAQKKLKRQPTLLWLREEIAEELERAGNPHDEKLARIVYNCLEEYTTGTCDMLAYPTNLKIDSRYVVFGMKKVPENNWEAVMVTILHYLSIRMDYNKKFQRATHLVVDECQVVSKKPGSARQLNDAVITFRKFGGIVTMAMQNITAALSNQMLTELYSNCSYKCFFDQGGVDAKSLGEIHEFSAKELKVLDAGKPGQGVMVWNKKVILFDSLIRRDNVLYDIFSTNFHEEPASTDARRERTEAALPGEEEKMMMREQSLSAAERVLVLDLAEITNISDKDVAGLIGSDVKRAADAVRQLVAEGALEEVGETGLYRKVR